MRAVVLASLFTACGGGPPLPAPIPDGAVAISAGGATEGTTGTPAKSDACAAVADLVATGSPSGVALYWVGAPGVTFELKRKTLCGTDDYAEVTTLPAGTTSYTDAAVKAGWAYFYELVATDATGSSATVAVPAIASSGTPGCATGASEQSPGASPTCDAPGTDAGSPMDGGLASNDGGTFAGHGSLRGRVKIAHGTVVTDDGAPLRMIHTYVHDFAVPYFSDITWWQQMHDVGHFNTVRVMAFLGAWSSAANAQQMDVPTLLARLDTMVALASKTGMYVLIDNHSECCGNQDVANDTALWQAVAPRYANDTNLLYELKNEPWQYSGLPAYEATLYDVIRPLAPDTHIICWTIENMIDLTDPLSLVAQAPGITYTNASFGWHPYGTYGKTTALLANVAAAKSKYPVVLTEIGFGAAGAPGDQSFLSTMETEGIGWAYLDFGFYDLDTSTAYGDPSFAIASEGLHITWPED